MTWGAQFRTPSIFAIPEHVIGVSEEVLQKNRDRLVNCMNKHHLLIVSLYPMTYYLNILKQHQSLEQYAEHGEVNHDLIK